jgi:hypothetical protein
MADDLITTATGLIVERLKGVFPGPKWHYAIVASPLTVDEWKTLARNTPLITVAFKGFKPGERSGRIAVGKLTFIVNALVKNERGREHRFLGDAAGPGLFPVTAMLIRQLNGATFPEVGTLMIDSADQSFAEGYDAASAAIATFEVSMAVEFAGMPDGEELNDFLRVQTSWTPTAYDTGAPPQAIPQDIIDMRAPGA